MKDDMKDEGKDKVKVGIDESIDTDSNTDSNTDKTTSNKFILKKKNDNKKGKTVFNVYMDDEKLNELDKMSKTSRWSRNELVNKMIDYCLANWEVEKGKK